MGRASALSGRARACNRSPCQSARRTRVRGDYPDRAIPGRARGSPSAGNRGTPGPLTCRGGSELNRCLVGFAVLWVGSGGCNSGACGGCGDGSCYDPGVDFCSTLECPQGFTVQTACSVSIDGACSGEADLAFVQAFGPCFNSSCDQQAITSCRPDGGVSSECRAAVDHQIAIAIGDAGS